MFFNDRWPEVQIEGLNRIEPSIKYYLAPPQNYRGTYKMHFQNILTLNDMSFNAILHTLFSFTLYLDRANLQLYTNNVVLFTSIISKVIIGRS